MYIYISNVSLTHADYDKMYEYLIITLHMCACVRLYTYTFVYNMIRYIYAFTLVYIVRVLAHNQPFRIYFNYIFAIT